MHIRNNRHLCVPYIAKESVCLCDQKMCIWKNRNIAYSTNNSTGKSPTKMKQGVEQIGHKRGAPGSRGPHFESLGTCKVKPCTYMGKALWRLRKARGDALCAIPLCDGLEQRSKACQKSSPRGHTGRPWERSRLAVAMERSRPLTSNDQRSYMCVCENAPTMPSRARLRSHVHDISVDLTAE